MSHTAAMAHVGSIVELLAHVALRWWQALGAELAARATGLPPLERLEAIGLRYRSFAVEHPRQFRLMYDERIWRAVNAMSRSNAGLAAPEVSVVFKSVELLPDIRGARDAAYTLFAQAVVDGQRDGTVRRDRPVDLLARLVASLAHGLAMEALDEGLPDAEAGQLIGLAVEGIRPLDRPITIPAATRL